MSHTDVTEQNPTPVRRVARKARVGAVGGATVAVGIVLIPLPGPGTLIILGGLTLLGREFPKAKELADKGWHQVRRVVGVFARK